jgi:hypothetical protein
MTFGDELPQFLFARAVRQHAALRQRLLHAATIEALHCNGAGGGGGGGASVPPAPLASVGSVGVHSVATMALRLRGDEDVDPVWDTDPDEEVVPGPVHLATGVFGGWGGGG